MQFEIYNISHNQKHKIAEFADLQTATTFVNKIKPRFGFQKYEIHSKTEIDVLYDIQRALNDYKFILERDRSARDEIETCKKLLRTLDNRMTRGVVTGLNEAIDKLRGFSVTTREVEEEPAKEPAEEYDDPDL